MAMNVWGSRGAGPRMPALGLGRMDLTVPNADAIGSLGERLRHHGFAVRDDGRTLGFSDPWNNEILASVAH
jgi:catechol 2,3-dioxygenase